jgi:hypothetical protein
MIVDGPSPEDCPSLRPRVQTVTIDADILPFFKELASVKWGLSMSATINRVMHEWADANGYEELF